MTSTEWMVNARCAGHPTPEIFFPTMLGLGSHKQAQEAITVCSDCPVIAQCAAFQRATGSVGVWGSTLIGTKQAGMVVRTIPALHGTEAAAARHRRRGERPCRSCLDAEGRESARRAGIRARRAGA